MGSRLFQQTRRNNAPPVSPSLPVKRRPYLKYLLIGAAFFLLYLLGDYMWREMRWRFIVVHHTAADSGNMEYYRTLHKKKHGWPDIAYHFLINNGSMNTSIGQIEVSGLWEKRTLNYSTKISYVNYLGIAVALVGNFENHDVHPLQYEALIQLLANLSLRYSIPPERIVGHGELQNTQCPGKHLDMSKVRADVARAIQRKRAED
ncbi:MAG: hypothetical protein CMN76_19710 [Spirochaetaceae bacterium]|nr:hypothetical protein [Spirochaetaceae bacterium]|tara:strand:- start:5107 stop:5718 length:612 start_codon:yes stop_codon:yes gene_type:complete